MALLVWCCAVLFCSVPGVPEHTRFRETGVDLSCERSDERPVRTLGLRCGLPDTVTRWRRLCFASPEFSSRCGGRGSRSTS